MLSFCPDFTVPPVSQLAQTELSTVRRESTRLASLPYWQLGILAGLSLWTYWPTLAHLLGQWWHDPNFSHGFFVPLFSFFVIWQRRDQLFALDRTPSWSGLAVLFLALMILIVGQMGAELFLARSSLLLLSAGLVILFFGWKVFGAVVFPWAFLLLMIPIPALLLNQVTFPLQLLASQVSAALLPLLGVPILREGNVINLSSMALEVAEAFSGIRSLMSLATVAIIYGYLMEKRIWLRWLLVFASVPIAIIANSLRVVSTGLLSYYWTLDASEGVFHSAWRVLAFVISLLMLYGLHVLVSRIFPGRIHCP